MSDGQVPGIGSPGQGFASLDQDYCDFGQDFDEGDFGQAGQDFGQGGFGQDFGQGGFGQDFGGFDNQECFGNMGFTDDDFKMGIDHVLQEEARSEGHVDYPDDFPPPVDVFGPGFDWETANLREPQWPKSFPGEPLGGHSMSSGTGSVHLDTTFDTSALQGPVNPQRLNALRNKLSKICSDQYGEILEMLKEDASTHHLEYGKLLKQATSDPFLDANATLAPVGSPGKSYAGSEYTLPRHVSPNTTRSTPRSVQFSKTGKTPPMDKTIKGYSSPSRTLDPYQLTTVSTPSSRSPSRSRQATPANIASPDFQEFDDCYSNLDSLMLLMKNQDQCNQC